MFEQNASRLLNEKTSIIATRFSIRPECKIAFADWQAKLNEAIAAFSGFVSLEFLVTPGGWLITERFTTPECATSWKSSPKHEELMQELQTLSFQEGFQETLGEESSFQNGITEVFVTQIDPEKKEEFR